MSHFDGPDAEMFFSDQEDMVDSQITNDERPGETPGTGIGWVAAILAKIPWDCGKVVRSSPLLRNATKPSTAAPPKQSDTVGHGSRPNRMRESDRETRRSRLCRKATGDNSVRIAQRVQS